MILAARLLAFLGLLLLAPLAQAETGDLSRDLRLIEAEALVEALVREDDPAQDADESAVPPARPQQRAAQAALSGPSRVSPQPATNPRHALAQPRAPPFRKV